MNILVTRLARFGDVVLLLPALTLLKAYYPACRITFLTDNRFAPLAEMSPAIDEIISVDRLAMRDGARLQALKNMVRVIRRVRSQNFDLAMDFHGFRETNLLTWLSGAPRRIGMRRSGESFLEFCFNLPLVAEDKTLHVRDMFIRIVKAIGVNAQTQASPLIVPRENLTWARLALPPAPYVTLYVDAPTPKRVWPPAHFAALADFLVNELEMNVVAIAGPQGESLLEELKGYSTDSSRIYTAWDLTIPQLAAAVYGSRLLISNDTGPMHLGPILGIPTLGLFSIGLPEHFRPAGNTNRFLQSDPIEAISVEAVVNEVREMCAIARPDPRR